MLRGAIELVNAERIDGWIYSEVGEVFNRTVLAFVDDHCVGSGPIGIVRDDLKRAGLADGRLGFSFPVTVDDQGDLPRMMVKLEGSDFVMLQNSATIAGTDSFQAPAAGIARLDWMRGRGMLSPAEAAFLKYVQWLGAFDYSLVQPKSAGGVGPIVANPIETAQGFLELLLLRDSEVREVDIAVSSFDEIGRRVLSEGGQPLSIVAIWSPDAAVISVVEGSHMDHRNSEGFQGAIEYHIGCDRLLFIDLGAQARLEVDRPAQLKVFAAY